MDDIAKPRGAVNDRRSSRIVARKYSDDVEQRGRPSRANIGHTGRDPRGRRGEDVGAGYVVNGDEVARLLAVAVDCDAFAVAVAAVEDRNHAGVGRRGVLARAKNVKSSAGSAP